ncbi:tetratricopeptide repeat protein [Polaromonas sp.]|uniref:tetratricopeptide repeat protein n=1 Tax=Polaromonas sp. TaxID=1869339 RepID=UPI0032672113
MNEVFERARQSFLEGLGHFQAGALPEAERCFELALALVPGRASTLTNLGATKVKFGKEAEALPLLEQATAAEPGNIEAWSYLGLAHACLAQHAQALACYEQALALDDGNALLWTQHAQALVRLGRPEEALGSFEQALARDAGLAEAWSHRGTLLREMNRLQDAAACFEKALALGADPQINGYFLASVRGAEAPATAPREYVEYLFDDYAAEFQSHLVGVLRYRAHEVLIRHLARGEPRRFSSVLDLGCGTGLCGPLIAPLADRVDGVDISRGMLDKARALGVYTALIHADVADYLRGAERRDDLVLAADVFIYVGDLSVVFAGVARVLRPGGLFCFTVERAADEEELVLLPSLRYAHSETYIRRLAHEHGFEVTKLLRAPLREDQQRPVEGLYVYLATG